MKAKKLFAAALLLATVASCQKMEVLQEEWKTGPHTVAITASLGGATKTLISQDAEGHFKGM